MSRRATSLALVLVGLWLAPAAPAAVPDQMNYQGLLLDDLGDPVTGNVALVFTLYDALLGGSPAWTESHPSVPVLDGVYDVVLGATSPLTPALLGAGPLFLEIEVAGETLSPRQQLLAVPYAIRAEEAESVGGFEGGYVNQIIQNFAFDGADPPNDDPSEGLADVDGDGLANFVDSDNDDDGLSDAAELGIGSDINLVTPTLSGIAPQPVEASATVLVTVTGTNFEAGQSVGFGSESPAPQGLTPTSFDVSVGPQPAGSVAVQVTRTNGQSASTSFQFTSNTPSITSLTPDFQDSLVTDTVTVAGSGFVPGLDVSFGSENPAPQNLTPTSFDVVVGPQAPGPVTVTVSYPSGQQDSEPFTFVDTSDENTVFITSTTYDGNLGGVAGADAECNARAAAVPLSGTYRAWVGSDSSSPNTTFTNNFAYVRTDGALVASSYTDLTDGSIQNPIRFDEFGVDVGTSVPVWTGVLSNGNSIADDCVEWTSSSSGGEDGARGLSGQTGTLWSYAGTQGCDTPSRLYCFEQ